MIGEARRLSRIAIVNRGEPALRLIRAVRELNIAGGGSTRTIALYTDPDERSLYVREADEAVGIGPATVPDPVSKRQQSAYLDLHVLERALREARADAAWVGWGFVAERPEFAELCTRLGIVFIGPGAQAMRLLGDKVASKQLAERVGVPLAAWSGGPVSTEEEARQAADRIGYPLMIKASAGGGGRGVRRVTRPEELWQSVAAARAEARSAFGDPTVFLERFLAGARHVEVQVACDGQGGAWALGVRDCSVQRRHQKVIEESGSTILDECGERELREASVRLCSAAGYRSLATVEFLVDPKSGAAALMEVNTRLQVEHPVTEATTGLDLVKLQLEIATGGRLAGDPPPARGWAIEARLYAEDPDNGFAPSAGVIELLRLPGGPGIRVDTDASEGQLLPSEFDSMIAKVVAWGRDRDEALARLGRALRETAVVIQDGTTNRAFLLRVLNHPAVRRGNVDVGWLEREGPEPEMADPTGARIALIQAAIEAYERELRHEQAEFYAAAGRGRPEAAKSVGRAVELRCDGRAYRLMVYRLGPQEYRVAGDDGHAEVRVERLGRFERRLHHAGRRHQVVVTPHGITQLVEVDGAAHRVAAEDGGIARSPSPAVISAILVQPGDHVSAGTPVAMVEAMKMESVVVAPVSGVVSRVLVAPNVQVAAGAPLVVVEASGNREESAAEAISLSSPEPEEPDPAQDRCLHNLEILRRMVLGFDADPAAVSRVVAEQARLSQMPCAGDPAVRRAEDAILAVFADVCALATRHAQDADEASEGVHSAQDHFFAYLRTLDTEGAGLPARFLDRLQRALAHYGVRELRRTPELEESLFWIFKSHQRVEQQLPAITSILADRLDRTSKCEPGREQELRELLERIAAATQGRFPAIADLARETLYRTFDQPVFERSRRRLYAEAVADLDYLAATPDADDRAERVERLVQCPQPLQSLLVERAGSGDAGTRQLVLEVLTRRYYRVRTVESLRTFEACGRTLAEARYREDGRTRHVVAALGPHDEVGSILADLRPALAPLPEGERAELDLYVWRPQSAIEPDAAAAEVRETITAAQLPPAVDRVLVAMNGPRREIPAANTDQFSFRRSPGGFEEDRLCRGLHPMMAERLDMWRLSNFESERLPSVEDVYVFHSRGRENPKDERLFAMAEVRDLTPVRDASGRVMGLPHLERMFLEALTAIRHFQSLRPMGQRLHWNRVVLHVWPPLDVEPAELHAIVNRLAPATTGLGMEKTVVRVRMRDARTGELTERVIHLSNALGTGVVLMRVDEPTDRPIQPLAAYQQKVVQMRRRGLVYPHEIITLLASAPEGGATVLPPGDFQEHDLDADGRLVPVTRPPGENRANLIVGVIRNFTWKHPEGMARVILLGDPSRSLGALAEPECRRVIAALDLAERMEVPLEWFTLSSGARISMDSGTENMDWIAAVLRRLVDFTQAGGEVNLVVNGINVGAQPYWNAEATMLMHTRGILVMTPDGAMVLTGKQALDYSGSVSAEDNYGIGGYERIMGPNGQAQYWAPDLTAACQILIRHYAHTYRAPGERFPRRAATTDSRERDVRSFPHPPALGGFSHVGDIFSSSRNAERKHPFDIRAVMAAVIDQDLTPLERWPSMRGGETAVVWDAHLGGNPVCLLGIESRPLPRPGPIPQDGPREWTAGTLFPQSSRKLARAINAASANRPVVVLANLSGFDGSPESMRKLQLEFGAEIGRAVVNFRGPMVFCVVSRYHGGAFVVFSARLNDQLEVAAVEGSYASVIGGAPAAAVVFTREVESRARADERVTALERRIAAAEGTERALLRARLSEVLEHVRSEQLGAVAQEFDAVHSVQRAQRVGSVHRIIPAAELRPYLIDAVERGMRRELGEKA